jgi:hypothetical protein
MKILGVTHQKKEIEKHTAFLNYIGALFQKAPIEVCIMNTSKPTISPKLILLSVSEDTLLTTDAIAQYGLNEVPVFLLLTTAEISIEVHLLEKLTNEIESSGGRVVANYQMPNWGLDFDLKKGIIPTTKFIALKRIVNRLKQVEFLPYYPENKFTCGIDPTRKFYGQEDGY